MTVIRKETLVDYGFAIERKQEQRALNGMPQVDPETGDPVMVDVCWLRFVAVDNQHVVEIPLTEEGRLNLARELQGGIVPAEAGALVGLGELQRTH